MITLTTPAMASEPYSEDPLCLRISIRFTTANGMLFKSTELPFSPLCAVRWPLISTNVLVAGRPRSVTLALPLPPLLTAVLIGLPETSGSKRISSAIVWAPIKRISAAVIILTGVNALASNCLKREPVTDRPRIKSSSIMGYCCIDNASWSEAERHSLAAWQRGSTTNVCGPTTLYSISRPSISCCSACSTLNSP